MREEKKVEMTRKKEKEKSESDIKPEIELSSCIGGQLSGRQPWVTESFGLATDS